MKTSKLGKRFTVVLTDDLYKKAKDIAENCFMSVEDVVQRTVELNLMCEGCQKKEKDEDCPKSHKFNFSEVDF